MSCYGTTEIRCFATSSKGRICATEACGSAVRRPLAEVSASRPRRKPLASGCTGLQMCAFSWRMEATFATSRRVGPRSRLIFVSTFHTGVTSDDALCMRPHSDALGSPRRSVHTDGGPPYRRKHMQTRGHDGSTNFLFANLQTVYCATLSGRANRRAMSDEASLATHL